MAPRKKSTPAKKAKPATRSASVSTKSTGRNKSTRASRAKATSRKTKTSAKKKSPKLFPKVLRAIRDDDVAALDLTIVSIGLNPDPPQHDESFTVTVLYTPPDAALQIEVFVNGVLKSSKAAAARMASFSPDELGNPAAGATGQVKATISHPDFNNPVTATRSFTFA